MELQSESIKNIASALMKVQENIQNPKKDSKNPYFKSDYVSIESVLQLARSALPAEGMFFTQQVAKIEGNTSLITMIYHVDSGEFIRSIDSIVVKDQFDPQKIAACYTYFRRYALMNLLGIVGSKDDDDGNKASAPKEQDPNTGITEEQFIVLNRKINDSENKDEILKTLKDKGIDSLYQIRSKDFEPYFKAISKKAAS